MPSPHGSRETGGVAVHRKPARGPPRPQELWVQLADEVKEPLASYQEAVTANSQ